MMGTLSPTLLAHRPQNFQGKTRAVLRAAAVFVPALVDARAQELAQEVTMSHVQLQGIEPGLEGA